MSPTKRSAPSPLLKRRPDAEAGRAGRPERGGHRERVQAQRQDSPLNEPWGLAIAPSGFGPFAGDLLVGNLGNGWINAFNPTTGTFQGVLDNSSGYPITIHGLWGLRFGNSAFAGPNSLVFSAGPNVYSNGVVGIIKPG